MNSVVASSYRVARQITRARARNFYFGICLLPRERRNALCAIYAFMRHADDIADSAAGVEERRSRLVEWRQVLDQALAGDYSGSLISPAFHDAVKKYGIPDEYFHELITGTEMDLTIKSYRTFDELRLYCYRVASVVGLCSLHVFGFTDPRAKPLAEQCGVAFQLTNILRDVREDAADGRCYLPEEEMKRFGVTPGSLASGNPGDAFVSLLRFQAARAREYYEQSWPLIGLVAAESRAALWTMIAIYRRLLETIDREPTAVLERRVSLTLYEKMSFAARGMAMLARTRAGLREEGVPDWQPLA